MNDFRVLTQTEAECGSKPHYGSRRNNGKGLYQSQHRGCNLESQVAVEHVQLTFEYIDERFFFVLLSKGTSKGHRRRSHAVLGARLSSAMMNRERRDCLDLDMETQETSSGEPVNTL